MPRNSLDAIAHTRAMNRAKARLAKLVPDLFASLYEEEYAWARTEARLTNGERFEPGPHSERSRDMVDRYLDEARSA
jgi:hypothetical protein